MQKLDFKLLTGGTTNGSSSRLGGTSYQAGDTLSPIQQSILLEVQKKLGMIEGNESLTSKELNDKIEEVAEKLGVEIIGYEKDQILKHIEQDRQLFGPLQKLVDDPSVSDIIVSDFGKVAAQIGRGNHRTDIRWPSQVAYETFVERLLQKAGSTYSTKQPMADGMIGDYARISAVHKSICSDGGPYLTIRLNRFGSVTLDDLVQKGSAPAEVYQYLSAMVQIGATVFVAGEVGTGKTTITRALAQTVAPEESILVIEDTPEIRLDHPHVRNMVTRPENVDGEGRIAPAQCIKAGMRMAMNRIVFGEIRDAEAAEAFIDVCASGHPGVSTIHARSAEEAIGRLELFLGRAQRGASKDVLTTQIGQAVQVIVFAGICKHTKKRRIREVVELTGAREGTVSQRARFTYRVQDGLPEWVVNNKASAYREEFQRHGLEVANVQYPSTLGLDENVLFQEVLR